MVVDSVDLVCCEGGAKLSCERRERYKPLGHTDPVALRWLPLVMRKVSWGIQECCQRGRVCVYIPTRAGVYQRAASRCVESLHFHPSASVTARASCPLRS